MKDLPLLKALPVPVYTTDREGEITFFNEAAAEFWGRRPERGTSKWCGFLRLFWPDGRPMSHDECPMAEALREGSNLLGKEAVAERPDGKRIMFASYPVPLKDDEGRVTGGVNLLIDITERKEAENAAARLAAIVSSSDDAIVSKTLDGIVTSWNEGAVKIFGYQPHEMIGESIRKIIPDELQAEEDVILGRLRQGERIEHFETVRVTKDGQRIDVSITVSPVKDNSGKLIGASKIGRNITERKKAAARSAQLAAIISTSDDAIISKELDSVITSWNEGAKRIFGYEPEEIIGRSIRQLIPPELQQQEDEILDKINRGERIDHFDTVRLSKDGTRIDVSLSISPILDGNGKVVGASQIARDVSERKRSEDLQRLLFNELNHRVKNTLATIQAIAGQSMRTATSPSEFVSSFNGRVIALARAHDLLAEREMSGSSIGRLIREQVELGSEHTDRVVCSGPDVTLDARTTVQMALVLHELATNARKYGALSTPTGKLAITWQISLRNSRQLHLEWRESGMTDLRAPHRRGFGTTLIERSLQANQGETSLQFGADGLVCNIRLPLPDEDTVSVVNSGLGEREVLRTTKATAHAHHGKRILVVEDEPLVAMEIQDELQSHGFEVIGPVSHVESAKKLIASEQLDAALLDVNLGGESSGELAALLTARKVPFAYATGYGREGLPAGSEDVQIIAKPFPPGRLIAAVHQLLDGPRHPDNVVSMSPRKR